MRAYLTRGQEARANRMLRVHCDIYNACLEERIKAWRMNGISVNYGMQSAQLPAVRQIDPRVAEFSASAEQRTVRRVDRTFKAFFDRCKRGETPGFPRYRSWRRFDTVDHTAGDGSKWTPTEGRWARAYFQGVGHIKVGEHTRVVGTVKQISLVRDGRRWFVVAVATSEVKPLASTGLTVGIDVGIARFATTSDGEIIDNPRFLGRGAAELADLQRRKALNPTSKNLKRKIGKLHRRVKNQRREFHHQTARRLVDTYDTLAIEDLKVQRMSRITDVGWAQFRTILTAKAENAGRVVIAVNPAYTSIDCHRCGRRCTRPQQDTVVCPTCGSCDADLNGAHNIHKRAGLGSQVAA